MTKIKLETSNKEEMLKPEFIPNCDEFITKSRKKAITIPNVKL